MHTKPKHTPNTTQMPSDTPSTTTKTTSNKIWLLRIPKPAHDDTELLARQAEFQGLVAKLREMNEKGGGGSKKGEAKGKMAKRVGVVCCVSEGESACVFTGSRLLISCVRAPFLFTCLGHAHRVHACVTPRACPRHMAECAAVCVC